MYTRLKNEISNEKLNGSTLHTLVDAHGDGELTWKGINERDDISASWRETWRTVRSSPPGITAVRDIRRIRH